MKSLALSCYHPTDEKDTNIEPKLTRARTNDLEVHKSLQRMNYHHIAFRTAFTRGFDDIILGNANINSTTIRTTSEIRDSVGAMNRDQAIRHDQLTRSASGTEHLLHELRSDIFLNSSQTSTQLSQLSGDIKDLFNGFQLRLCTLSESNTITTVFHGSPTQAAKSLDYLSPHISELISIISAGTQLGSSAEHLSGFVGEFERLLDDAVTAKVMELKAAPAGADQHQLSSIDPVKMRQNLLKDAVRTFRGKGATRGGLPGHETRVANIALPGVVHKEVQTNLPTGTFYVIVGTTTAVHHSAQRTWMLRLLFIPNIIFRINGLAATFINTMDDTTKIGPFVSTFGIQPNESPIFAHIWEGDIVEVQELFSAKKASVSDRDEYGTSLLAACICMTRLGTC